MSLNSREQTIHDSAVQAARDLKRAESRLIEILIEVEKERVWQKLGHSSLFRYVTDALGLTEAMTYQAITVARKSAEIPALRKEILAGTIGVSTASKMAAVIQENPPEWLQKAKSLSTRALEKAVAQADPKQATPEKAKYVSADRLNLSLGLTEDAMLGLRKAQHLVSASLGRNATLEETLSFVVGFYLKAKDPVERARRSIARKGLPHDGGREASSSQETKSSQETNSSREEFSEKPRQTHSSREELQQDPRQEGPLSSPPLPPARSPGSPTRAPLPAAIKHFVFLRDQGRCQHPTPQGRLCGSPRWIDIHHRVPVSRGGTDQPENLVTICKTHHRYVHRT